MKHLKVVLAIVFCAIFVFVSTSVFSAENQLNEKAMKIYEKHKDSLIMVKIIMSIKVSYQGQEQPEQEQEIEVPATIINGETGLVVAALSYTMPPDEEDMQQQYKIDAKVKECKIRFNDGKETPAKIVLKDKDNDLIFIQPEKLESRVNAVSSDKQVKLNVLDEVVVIEKLGKSLNYEPGASICRVNYIIKKPREMYILSEPRYLCNPVFSIKDESIVGILVLLKSKGRQGSMVVMPMNEIMEAAKQIKPEKK